MLFHFENFTIWKQIFVTTEIQLLREEEFLTKMNQLQKTLKLKVYHLKKRLEIFLTIL